MEATLLVKGMLTTSALHIDAVTVLIIVGTALIVAVTDVLDAEIQPVEIFLVWA